MEKKYKNKLLFLVAFIGGMMVMIAELSASRLLAPYFGSSLFIWTNIIGLIMVFLAVGYWLGGRISDKKPEARILFSIILLAGVFLFFSPFLVRPLSSFASSWNIFANFSYLGLFLGSFIVTFLLFVVPVTCLGMVCPFIIRLVIREKEEAGSAAGLVFALSTIGSIGGTFLTSLVLIPYLGTRQTIFLAAAVLIVISFPMIFKRKLLFLIFLPLVGLSLFWAAKTKIKADKNIIFEDESAYQYIQVEKKDKTLYLKLEDRRGISSIYRPDEVLTGMYYDYYSILPYLCQTNKQDILIIGLAGGSMVREYDYFFKDKFDLKIDGVEIDKKLISTAYKYFNIGQYPNLNIYNTDGRVFLKETNKKYDIIIVDAYSRQLYIPFHLSTKEFFEEIFSHLKKHGILAFNINAVSEDSSLLQAFSNTVAKIFPYTYLIHFSEDYYNYVVLGSQAEVDFSKITEKIDNDQLKSIGQEIQYKARRFKFNQKKPILTDNKAPIEFLTDKMFFEMSYY